MGGITQKAKEDFVRDNFIYDPATGEVWWSKPRGVNRDLSKPCGGVSARGYLHVGTTIEGKHINLRLHQVAWFLFYCVWPERMIDHKDNDKTNNALDNLRLASDRQNSHNSKGHKDSMSGYKGVSWDKRINRWVARLHTNGKSKHIGSFIDALDAAEAYNKVAKEVFGEFAFLNDIRRTEGIAA